MLSRLAIRDSPSAWVDEFYSRLGEMEEDHATQRKLEGGKTPQERARAKDYEVDESRLRLMRAARKRIGELSDLRREEPSRARRRAISSQIDQTVRDAMGVEGYK